MLTAKVYEMCLRTLKNRLTACPNCNGSGMVLGMGGMQANCKKCRLKRRFVDIGNRIKLFVFNKPIQKFPVGFTVSIFLFYYLISKDFSELTRGSSLVGLIGLIFAALKYKLDQANYQKSLFDERYKLFCQIEEVINRANASDATDEGLRMLDEVINKCQFLFGKVTLEFIIEIRSNFIQLIYFKKRNYDSTPEVDKALGFFASLITLKSLPSKFPELIINNY